LDGFYGSHSIAHKQGRSNDSSAPSSALYAQLHAYNAARRGPLGGAGGEGLQGLAQRQRRSMVSVSLYRLVNMSRGLRALRRWRLLARQRQEEFRLEYLNRALFRFRQNLDRIHGLRSVQTIAERYSEQLLQRRAVRQWRRRMKLKAKFEEDTRHGNDFYFFNKCAVAVILWYSVSKKN
jgi:hypothetical protein